MIICLKASNDNVRKNLKCKTLNPITVITNAICASGSPIFERA